jgi:hypothetical protein
MRTQPATGRLLQTQPSHVPLAHCATCTLRELPLSSMRGVLPSIHEEEICR